MRLCAASLLALTAAAAAARSSDDANAIGDQGGLAYDQGASRLGSTCAQEGFLGDEVDCSKFYRCVDGRGGGFTQYQFTCPPGTIWDPVLVTCNVPWAANRPECAKVDSDQMEERESPIPQYPNVPYQYEPQPIQDPQQEVSPGPSQDQDYNPAQYEPDIPDFPISNTLPQGEPLSQYDQDALYGQQPIDEPYQSPAINGQEQYMPNVYSTGPDPSQVQRGSIPNYFPPTSTYPQPPPEMPYDPEPQRQYTDQNRNEGCTSEGFFADPESCYKFYECVEFDTHFVRFPFTCAPGTVWDQAGQTCNHPWAVQGKCFAPLEFPSSEQGQEPVGSDTRRDEGLPGPCQGDHCANEVQGLPQPAPDCTPPLGYDVRQPPPNDCLVEGYTPDPDDCRKFFKCVLMGSVGMVKYSFTCLPNSVWDPSTNACNHPSVVQGVCGRAVSIPQQVAAVEVETPTQSAIQGQSGSSTDATSAVTAATGAPTTTTEIAAPVESTTLVSTDTTISIGPAGTAATEAPATTTEMTAPIESTTLTSTDATISIGPTGTADTEAPATTTEIVAPIESTTLVSTDTTISIGTVVTAASEAPTTTTEIVTPIESTTLTSTDTTYSIEITTTETPESSTDSNTRAGTQETEYTSTSEVTTTGESGSESTSPFTMGLEMSTDRSTTVPPSTVLTETTTMMEVTTMTPETSTSSSTMPSDSTSLESSTESATSTLPETKTYGTTISIESTQEPDTTLADSMTMPSTVSTPSCPVGELMREQIALVCPTGFRRHPRYCDMFYQCTVEARSLQMKLLVLACPAGTVYEDERTQCLPAAQAQPCSGHTLAPRMRRMLARQLPLRVIVDEGQQLCPGAGHHPLPSNLHDVCNNVFVKCERPSDSAGLQGYVYQCPSGHTFSMISKQCEPGADLGVCASEHWDIPIDTSSIAGP